jgi:8-oxo-dGTP pyrophosphatase MutT (NUDIX family)
MNSRSNNLTEIDIINRLAKFPKQELSNPYPPGLLADEPRHAAVLIPLLQDKNRWHVLFIHRTANQHDPHSGQVAFPGGASESGDPSPEATALRETEEEIGLKSEDVMILGRLRDYLTITSYQVTPVVARIPWPYHLKLAHDEVSRVFSIPLNWLADPANHEVKDRKLPPPYDSIPVIYFKPYDNEILWGASARFTLGLLDQLFGNHTNRLTI